MGPEPTAALIGVLSSLVMLGLKYALKGWPIQVKMLLPLVAAVAATMGVEGVPAEASSEELAPLGLSSGLVALTCQFTKNSRLESVAQRIVKGLIGIVKELWGVGPVAPP